MSDLQGLIERLEQTDARDYADTFQYPRGLSPRMLRSRYERGDIVRALVDARPDATWAGEPQLLLDEDESEELARLAKHHKLWRAWARADLFAEITGYSVILIPGMNLAEPPTAEEARSYQLAVYGADDITWEEDSIGADLRPERYTLGNLVDDQRRIHTGFVHGQRCVHVADSRYSRSILKGNPRIISAYNRALDFDKVLGGGAEGFFRAVLPQYILGYDPTKTDANNPNFLQELWKFATGKLRALRTSAVKFERVAPDPADFEGSGDFLLKVLAAAFRVPLPEVTHEALVAHSASIAQGSWLKRISQRRTDFAESEIVAPSMVHFLSVLNGGEGMWTPEDAARIGVAWDQGDSPTIEELGAQTDRILASVTTGVVDAGYALTRLPEPWFGPENERVLGDAGLEEEPEPPDPTDPPEDPDGDVGEPEE